MGFAHFIFAVAAYQIHQVVIVKSNRLDDAKVFFDSVEDDGLAGWNRVFDYVSRRKTESEKCDRFPDVEDVNDISPCVKMTLYTRDDPQGTELILGDRELLQSSGFLPGERLLVITHGFFRHMEDDWMDGMKKAFIAKDDINVITLDWSLLSMRAYYPTVVQNGIAVGRYLAEFLDFFVEEGTKLTDVHLIGHSMGAHIAGIGSSESKGIVGRITALDPAKPQFTDFDNNLRLDKSDAEFVDCIHTSGSFLGIFDPFCHADFYPNGGLIQPGCQEFHNMGRCGHLRGPAYFTETINESVTFEVYQCSSACYMDPVTCWRSEAVLGYPANKSFQGIFYVETGFKPPYNQVPSFEELEDAENHSSIDITSAVTFLMNVK